MSGNRPVLLPELPGIWRVTQGSVHIFAVQLQARRLIGRREFLLLLSPPQAFVGALDGMDACFAHGLTLMAVGTLGCEIQRLDKAGDQVPAIESWLTDLDRAGRDFGDAWADAVAAPGKLMLAGDGTLVAPPGALLWATERTGDLVTPEGLTIPPGTAAVPITSVAPLRARHALGLHVISTATLIEQDGLRDALRGYQERTLPVLAALITARNAERAAFSTRGAQASWAREAEGLMRLAGVGRRKAEAQGFAGASPAWRAFAAAAHALGQSVTSPQRLAEGAADDRGMAGLAEACGLHARHVVLKSAWWRGNYGPLIGALAESGDPVALLPEHGGYVIWNPATGTRERAGARLGHSVRPVAVMLYRRFSDQPVSLGGVLSFSLSRPAQHIGLLIGLGLLGGLLGLFVPWATGTLVDSVVPRSSIPDLAFLASGLCVVAISNAGVTLVRSLLLQRMEQEFDLAAQSALFDRALRLPVAFLRRFSLGDLADRLLGLQTIRDTLTGAALSGALSGAMSLMNIAMMLVYSVKLALFGIAAASLLLIIGVCLLWRQLGHGRALATARSKTGATVLQVISGIAKLKVAGAVGRAHAIWANLYAQQRDHFVAMQGAANAQAITSQTFLQLSMAALFYMAAGDMLGPAGTASGEDRLGLGAFLGVTAAYGQLLAGASGLLSALSAGLRAVPAYERAMPLLTASPEPSAGRSHPGVLSGHIEVSNLTFRYPNSEAPVLQNLSFSILPGQFVAFVGPSGSGKSTVLRMLLGFETPERGDVLYGGKPLSGLDIVAVRRQLGVVLQNGRVQPASILENIAGGRLISLDEAWDAARLAGLADDIRAMPMGMHTRLTDGGATLSGGQRQRLMIARAIAVKPRILLMDEATSELDNRTQAGVIDAVLQLNLTRITIAHRLSSITRVDRVLVFDRGQVIQDGAFQRLLESPGLFRDLAQRQRA